LATFTGASRETRDIRRSRLLALHSDCIGGFAVNGVVANFQRRVVHAQRYDERDHLEDDVGCDHVIDDNEGRAVDLQQQLAGVAEEEARYVDAGRLLIGADILSRNEPGRPGGRSGSCAPLSASRWTGRTSPRAIFLDCRLFGPIPGCRRGRTQCARALRNVWPLPKREIFSASRSCCDISARSWPSRLKSADWDNPY
jgi:hypothetical protein